MARFRFLVAVALFTGCSPKSGGDAAAPPASTQQVPTALTPFELEHGIGPVKEVVTLGAFDRGLADLGKATYEAKCSACHKMTEKYVGPALGEVTVQRSPTFIMNMVLNPMEMVERHPIAKQLLAEHMTFMANQSVTVDEARAIVEYLRAQATGTVRTQ